ncbi:type VI secretion system tip protein VgrG, partial [Pseudomonas aeruginosa]
DQYGRIKIQFPWDRDGKNDETSSCWVRVVLPWSGKGFGMQFVPRIGQEVIVTFIDGDPDRPLVTGCVYNGDNALPYALPDNQTQSGIKTNSWKG